MIVPPAMPSGGHSSWSTSKEFPCMSANMRANLSGKNILTVGIACARFRRSDSQPEDVDETEAATLSE